MNIFLLANFSFPTKRFQRCNSSIEIIPKHPIFKVIEMICRIALEFYQRRKRQWPLPDDQVPWEVWQLQLDIVDVRENGSFFVLYLIAFRVQHLLPSLLLTIGFG